MPTRSGRARPLPPDERRAALVAATLPLILEHGNQVTTRQIAQASGVAEGTIFRVFPDKQSLIYAAVASTFDPLPTLEALDRVGTDPPLDDRLVRAVEILQDRIHDAYRLLTMLEMRSGPPPHAGQDDGRQAKIVAGLTTLVAPDAEQLNRTPAEIAKLLMLVTLAGTIPRLTDTPLSPEEIVSVLLDGVRKR